MLTVGLITHLVRTLNRKVVKIAMSCAEQQQRDSLETGLILAELHAEQAEALLYRDGNVTALSWRSFRAHATLLYI